ncbi:MAG: hypothetical protein A2Z88_05440 [Omnitrophica WOR_2 bacterium GWA2_47_8]|nr:MAG: hypothetical protein A2Z88_05440 [Omnitrophica WOR_2 bacterium GWA2_47_8]
MYKETTLSNGLRVISYEMKDRESIGIGLLVGTGGRFETDNVKGAAHFLEHIVFKGTQKYSCEAIKEKVEGVGGALNAFTTEEISCFYSRIPAKHLAKTFDVLSDMVFFPSITKEDVSKESGVIIEEIKMYHDLPQYQVLEFLDSLMWPGHQLGKSLIGSVETIQKMSNDDLRGFHQEHYSGRNVVVAACGRLKHKELVDIVQAKLKKIIHGEKKSFVKVPEANGHPGVKFFRKPIEQMHLALGARGLEINHKDRYVLSLLNIILGGNMSSRLFDEVREKRGLAYSIGSSFKSFQDTGMFTVRAGVDNKKIVDALKVILHELKKMKQDGVSADEFKRAKDFYLGQVVLGLEDTLDHMLWIGEDLLCLNRTRSLKELIREIGKVKVQNIKRLAQYILDEKYFKLAIVGPLDDQNEKDLQNLMNIN